MFKHCIVYELTEVQHELLNTQQLNEKLASTKFVEPSPQSQSSEGFLCRDNAFVSHISPELFALTFVEANKKIPSKALVEEVKKIEQRYKLKGEDEDCLNAFLRAREALLAELLPKTLPEIKETSLIVDTKNRYIFVFTTTNARAEKILSSIRSAIGSLKVMPTSNRAIKQDFQRLALGKPTQFKNLSVDDEIIVNDGAVNVKFNGVSVTDEAVKSYVESGYAIKKMALVHASGFRFVVDDQLRLTKISQHLSYFDDDSNQDKDHSAQLMDCLACITDFINQAKE